MEDYYFEGKIVWGSNTITNRDINGRLWYGEKYVAVSLDRTQSVAFTVWDDEYRELLRKNANKGVFCLTLHLNAFEINGNYYTNIKCTSATLKKKRG